MILRKLFEINNIQIIFFRYFHRGMELLENMRSYFEGLAGELQQVSFSIIPKLRPIEDGNHICTNHVGI